MKYLTLIRHAKSDWSKDSLPDFDRPLNSRGKKAAPLMGRRLAERGTIPELLISSPAKRARKTAKLIARKLGIPKHEIVYRPEMYAAGEETLVDVVGTLPGHCNHAALVGHNPGISELASWLCPQAPGWMPTCAILTLVLDSVNWKDIKGDCGHIHYYDYPKKNCLKHLPGSC